MRNSEKISIQASHVVTKETRDAKKMKIAMRKAKLIVKVTTFVIIRICCTFKMVVMK